MTTEGELWHIVEAKRDDGTPTMFRIRELEPKHQLTKIFVVEAIGRISSASLPKISAPVSASMTTADLDFTSGRSPAHVGTTSPQRTPAIRNERIDANRDMSRVVVATFHQGMS